jgi:hypothetical protein
MTQDQHQIERMRAWVAFMAACDMACKADKMLAEFDKRFSKYPPTPNGFGPVIDGPPPMDAQELEYYAFEGNCWMSVNSGQFWQHAQAHCLKLDTPDTQR